ncbi:hypothetical protein BCT30_18880 [Enterovibrio norvegicus]|nr:hypothetical protein A1OW_13640 [Enterovibrio norvegicus]OEF57104.1 hypothetical protein A1OU_20385 [Enterovibrio norvegicus]PMI33815.1 hypothetical protein BCU47_08365 [Enterovibrio norvegicus]PMI39121.1 hypothetical protein BCU46_06705 [Enterovibrio norvegicus]PMN49576.1 hypothetical protein BCT30_18880 [Enterovibrio norvegicus]
MSSNTEHKIDSSPNDSCPIRKTAFAQGARFHVHDSADIQLKLNVLSLAESRLNTIQLSLFATNLRCYGDFVLNNNETLEITMKKTLTAVLVMLASSSAFAQAPTTELSVTTVRGGAFVQVTQDGEPISGYDVSTSINALGSKSTDENGFVYFSLSPQQTQRIDFFVIDEDGHKIKKTRTIERS